MVRRKECEKEELEARESDRRRMKARTRRGKERGRGCNLVVALLDCEAKEGHETLTAEHSPLKPTRHVREDIAEDEDEDEMLPVRSWSRGPCSR